MMSLMRCIQSLGILGSPITDGITAANQLITGTK